MLSVNTAEDMQHEMSYDYKLRIKYEVAGIGQL